MDVRPVGQRARATELEVHPRASILALPFHLHALNPSKQSIVFTFTCDDTINTITMAPMTRRSQAAAQAAANKPAPAPAPSTGISKRSRAAPASTRKEQSNNWELLDRESSHAEADREDLDNVDEHDELPDMDFSTTRTGGAVQTATDSLRDIADRVG